MKWVRVPIVGGRPSFKCLLTSGIGLWTSQSKPFCPNRSDMSHIYLGVNSAKTVSPPGLLVWWVLPLVQWLQVHRSKWHVHPPRSESTHHSVAFDCCPHSFSGLCGPPRPWKFKPTELRHWNIILQLMSITQIYLTSTTSTPAESGNIVSYISGSRRTWLILSLNKSRYWKTRFICKKKITMLILPG